MTCAPRCSSLDACWDGVTWHGGCSPARRHVPARTTRFAPRRTRRYRSTPSPDLHPERAPAPRRASRRQGGPLRALRAPAARRRRGRPGGSSSAAASASPGPTGCLPSTGSRTTTRSSRRASSVPTASEVFQFARERRTVVPLEEIPPVLRKAVLAAEDARFYEHEGVNYLAIARCAVKGCSSAASPAAARPSRSRW